MLVKKTIKKLSNRPTRSATWREENAARRTETFPATDHEFPLGSVCYLQASGRQALTDVTCRRQLFERQPRAPDRRGQPRSPGPCCKTDPQCATRQGGQNKQRKEKNRHMSAEDFYDALYICAVDTERHGFVDRLWASPDTCMYTRYDDPDKINSFSAGIP